MQTIHLTFDHPDTIEPNKTKAVKNLCASQTHMENIVFSLNRSWSVLGSYRPIKEPHGYSMRIFGFPYGFLLHFWMYLSNLKIKAIIKQNSYQPSVIHAHKLTFEGIIAYYLAKSLGIPYILTIRGNTDLVVIKHKRFFRSFYKKVIENAEYVNFLAPWTRDQIEGLFGKEIFRNKSGMIPNVVNPKSSKFSENKPNGSFVTVFRLQFLKGKNIERIIKAFDCVLDNHPEMGLDIIGEGPGRKTIQTWIEKSKYPDRYTLLGKVDNQLLIEKISNYSGFILPSFPETFGLVFVEAIMAGIPIIYSKNSGIDGYFENFKVGERVNHKSISEISDAIESVDSENGTYRKNIRELKKSGFLDQFSEADIGIRYTRILVDSVSNYSAKEY